MQVISSHEVEPAVLITRFRAVKHRQTREGGERHWCSPELVPYGWGHYTGSDVTETKVKSNQVQPVPATTTEDQTSLQSSREQQSEDLSDHKDDLGQEECIVTIEPGDDDDDDDDDPGEAGGSLDSKMMETLCESPHRFLATLDDDLSLDLPSVPL